VATSRKRSNKERRATAYHEAGHAVIAIALGLTVKKVSIVKGQDYNGLCRQLGLLGYHLRDRRDAEDTLKKIIISIYAGMPAQRLVDPDPPEFHGACDEEDANELCLRHANLLRRGGRAPDEFRRAYLGRRRVEARRLVKQHRKAIEEFAEVLLQRQELGGEEAEELIVSLLDQQDTEA
jgi:ATP-dependent Zn protease